MKSFVVLSGIVAAFGTFALVALPSVAAPSVQNAGPQAFAACRACHTLSAGGKSGIGPNLHGMFGRKAGSVPGFSYSPALTTSNLVWNAQTLDQYLAAPTRTVPGTRMVVKVADPAKRTALIAYLKAETSK